MDGGDVMKIRIGDFNYDDEDKTVYLPHSCDDWVIGSPDELGEFIKDAQEMLRKLKEI